MGWFNFPFLRSQRDAASFNNIYNSDITITCDDIIFYGRLAVMNRYTQYFSSNLAAMKHHITSNFNKPWHDHAAKSRRQLTPSTDEDGDESKQEEAEAMRMLREIRQRGANFDLSEFRPFVVYSVLVWCHKQEYPPKEIEERFIDRKYDVFPLINHIRTHHLARHLSIHPLIDLTLTHIRAALAAPMPLTEFLHAIPITYAPPTDLASLRIDPLKSAIIQRTIADIDELSDERQWLAVMQSDAAYASDVTMGLVEEKRVGRSVRSIGYHQRRRRRARGMGRAAGRVLRVVAGVLLVVMLVVWVVPRGMRFRGVGGRRVNVAWKSVVGYGNAIVSTAMDVVAAVDHRAIVRNASAYVRGIITAARRTVTSGFRNLPGNIEMAYSEIRPGLDNIADSVMDTVAAVGSVAGGIAEEAKSVVGTVPVVVEEWGEEAERLAVGVGEEWGEGEDQAGEWGDEEYAENQWEGWEVGDEQDGWVFDGTEWQWKE